MNIIMSIIRRLEETENVASKIQRLVEEAIKEGVDDATAQQSTSCD